MESTERVLTRKERGLCCSCNRPPIPGETRCQYHKDKANANYAAKTADKPKRVPRDPVRKAADAARYAHFVSIGICPVCEERPKCDESVFCLIDLNKQRAKQKAAAAIKRVEKEKAQAELLEQRSIARVCLGCDSADLFTDTHCRRCEGMRLEKEEGLTRYAARIKVGLCQKCPDLVTPPSTIYCDKHKHERREQHRADGEAGRCSCKQPVIPGKKRCVECRQKLLDRHAERKSRGVCRHCEQPVLAGRSKIYCKKHLAKARRKDADQQTKARAAIIAAYGGKCAWCEERNPFFLHLDHIHNDGAEHRRSVTGRNGSCTKLYFRLRDEGYPKDRLQLLCANCNLAKGFYGVCSCDDPAMLNYPTLPDNATTTETEKYTEALAAALFARREAKKGASVREKDLTDLADEALIASKSLPLSCQSL
jgi:hypothetical protein